MSDKFKIIALGDAGVNSISYIQHSLLFKIRGKNDKQRANKFPKTDYSIIVSSPAGLFSSANLLPIIEQLKAQGEKVFLISIMPFLSESEERSKRAVNVLNKVSKSLDKIFIIENENFAQRHFNENLDAFLNSINKNISDLINNLKNHMNSLEGFKNFGFAYSEGNTLEELNTNLIYTRKADNIEGIVGVIESPTESEATKISSYFGIDMLKFKQSDRSKVTAFTVHGNAPYSRWYPSELYIHTQLSQPWP